MFGSFLLGIMAAATRILALIFFLLTVYYAVTPGLSAAAWVCGAIFAALVFTAKYWSYKSRHTVRVRG